MMKYILKKGQDYNVRVSDDGYTGIDVLLGLCNEVLKTGTNDIFFACRISVYSLQLFIVSSILPRMLVD